ncbi:MAG: esterase-like activity of phytase family protein [Magnetospirillum sp. WYHS-4]
MRLLLVLGFLGLTLPALAEPIAVDAEAIPLDPRDPAVTTVGALHYRGGLVLRAPGRKFGGLSDLTVSLDGRDLTAISDAGRRLSLGLRYDVTGRLTGIGEADLSPLPGLDGRPLRDDKKEGDAEGLAPAPDGGFVVSFEHRHRLWHYPAGWETPRELIPPRELALAPRNSGIEALARLADGRLLALTESFMTQRGVVGWVGNEETGDWATLTYETVGAFYPTGATVLPNGDVLVLERRYTLIGGPAARLVRVGRTAFQPGISIKGDEVALLAPPLAVDNMEGLAMRRTPAGGVLLYLLSDDNFQGSQRTLLLLFEYRP